MCHPQGEQQELHVLCATVPERGSTQGEAESPCGEKVVSGLGDQVTTETKYGSPVLHGHVPMESIWFLVLIDTGAFGVGGVLVGVHSGLKGQTQVLRLGGRFLYQLCPQPAFIPSSETESVCLLSALSSS